MLVARSRTLRWILLAIVLWCHSKVIVEVRNFWRYLGWSARRCLVSVHCEFCNIPAVITFRVTSVNLTCFDSGFIRGPKWHPHTPYPQPPRSPFKSEEASPADDNGIRTALANALWPTAGPMAFSPTFEKGALLSVCWENGKIGFVPFLFMK